jgi:hypothetical protein
MLPQMDAIRMFSMKPHKRPHDLHLTPCRRALPWLLLVLLTACPGDPSPSEDTSTDTRPGGRSYLLAARAEAYDFTAARPATPSLSSLTIPGSTPKFAPAEPIPEVDRPIEAVVIPASLIGIPWTSFNGPDNRPSELPAAWLAAVESLESLAADANTPIVVALTPLSPEFDTLAPLASDQSGALVLNPTWKPACYDPSKDSNPDLHANQYAGYVTWMVERFSPRFVILGERLNLYETTCGPSAYAAVANFTAEARERLSSSLAPDKPLTAITVDVEDLYGFPKKPGRCQTGTPADCLESRKSLLTGLDADLLGLESYPFRAFNVATDIPSDWLSTLADLSTIPVFIAGTAIPSTLIETEKGACVPLFESSPDAQRTWLDQVLSLSSVEKAPLVVWRSLVDLLPSSIAAGCPCAGDFALCSHLDGLGGKADDRRLFLLSGLSSSPGGALDVWRTVFSPDP